MDRSFWKDYGVLVLCGIVGLATTTIVLSNLTGQPLLPRIDFKAELAPYLPGLLAILKTIALVVGICILAIIVGLATIPFRDWLEHQQEQRINRRASRVTHQGPVPVNDYQQKHRVAMPATDMLERAFPPEKIERALNEGITLRRNVIALLEQYNGHRDRSHDLAVVLVVELNQVVARLKQDSKPAASASQTALNGPSWRAVAELVSWYKKEPVARLRASRDAFRAIGVQVPDVDLQPGGDFNEWVRGLAEIKPSPTALDGPSVVEKQSRNIDGRRTDRRAAQRSQPRKRRG